MKTIPEIMNNYDNYKVFLEDRFGRRFCEFLTEEQADQIGFALSDEAKAKGVQWTTKEWTEKNVLLQLLNDTKFGEEKARAERVISSNLMFDVCNDWLEVLDLEYMKEDDHDDYGLRFFLKVQDYCNKRLKQINED